MEATLARRIAQLRDEPSPIVGVLDLLECVIDENLAPSRRAPRRARGLVRNRFLDVTDWYKTSNRELRLHLGEAVRLGQACGEIDAALECDEACSLILAVMEGIEISVRGGASVEAARTTARYAVRRLSAP